MICHPRNDPEQSVHVRHVQSGLDCNVSELQVSLSFEGFPWLLVQLYSRWSQTAEVVCGLK